MLRKTCTEAYTPGRLVLQNLAEFLSHRPHPQYESSPSVQEAHLYQGALVLNENVGLDQCNSISGQSII